MASSTSAHSGKKQALLNSFNKVGSSFTLPRMNHSAGEKSSHKPEIRSATLERNKKSNNNGSNRWDEGKPLVSAKSVERIKDPLLKDVAGNPVEVKKNESGESDPGYESDSNNKSGNKNSGKKVVPSSSSDIFPPKLIAPKDGERNKAMPKMQPPMKSAHKEKVQHVGCPSSASQTPRFNTLERREKKDVLSKIISPDIIEEMSNIKHPDSPVTLEIFSPVMVGCFLLMSPSLSLILSLSLCLSLLLKICGSEFETDCG